MQKSLDYDYVFKYILIGDASVGKSTILNHFINGDFKGDSNPTMGVQFATRKLHILDKIIKIQIWDTAGQESFRTITRAYYRNAIGIILVYDLKNDQSFKTIDAWLNEIHDNSNENVEIMIVANKADLVTNPPSQSPKPQFPFFVTSAKTGSNINKMFSLLSQSILSKINSGKIDAQNTSGIKKGVLLPDDMRSRQSEDGDQSRRKCC